MILIQQNNNIVQNIPALPVVDTVLYSLYKDKQKADIIHQKADIIYPKVDIIPTEQQSPKIDDHILQNLYNNIPKYNGEGDVQKLYDFIDKVESYLAIGNMHTDVELDIITMKLIGTASLWWKHYKKIYNEDSVNKIKNWQQLRNMLLQNKVTDKHESLILSQLESLQQKGTIQEYNTTFDKLVMQIPDLSLNIERHYYLKRLKQDIRQLVKSNRENFQDMTTLKLAYLRQDNIFHL